MIKFNKKNVALMSENEFAQYLGIDKKEYTEAINFDFKEAIRNSEETKKCKEQIPLLMKLCKLSYSQMASSMGLSKSGITRRIDKPERWSEDELITALKVLEKKWPY
jgi:hypothetical protein